MQKGTRVSDQAHKLVNGIDLEAFQTALDLVGSQPAARHAPKASRVRWVNGLKFKAMVRNHTFVVDEPAHLTGEDTSPNSVEYVLGAYGACLATGFVMNASKQGIEIRNLEVSLQSTQNNVFTFLGLEPSTEGHSGFEEITAKLFVQANADEATLRQIWAHTITTSPVHNILTHNATIKPEVDIIP
jgi:uncharacterized OsmC-like protein